MERSQVFLRGFQVGELVTFGRGHVAMTGQVLYNADVLAFQPMATFNQAQAQMAAKGDNSLREPVKTSRVGKIDQQSCRVIFLASS